MANIEGYYHSHPNYKEKCRLIEEIQAIGAHDCLAKGPSSSKMVNLQPTDCSFFISDLIDVSKIRGSFFPLIFIGN